MQVEEITQILRESPSVRLIKSRSVDFFLSFVIEAFEGQAAIMQERLHMLLENRLDIWKCAYNFALSFHLNNNRL